MSNTIYRYINWNDEGLKKILSENELFFYSAEKWKKDGEYSFELVEYTQERIFDIVLDIAIDMHNTDRKQYELWMNVHAQKYGIDLHKLLPVEVDLADQYFASQIAKERVAKPDEFVEVQRQLYFDRTGIISFSKTKYSYNLWSSKRNTFSDNVVCVGIDVEKLKERLKNEANCIMSEMAYSDELHKYKLVFDKTGHKSLLQLLDISFSLSTKFSIEDEVRIQRLLVDNTAESKERSILLPNDVFVDIIVFKDADEVTYSEVVKLANDKGIKKIGIADLLADDISVAVNYL